MASPPASGGGHEPIVTAAVDLLHVLVEAVNEIARGHGQRQVDGRRVDAKGPVRQIDGKVRTGRLAVPDGRQGGEDRAVAIDLRELRRRRVRDAVGPGEKTVEVVEAPVLRVDDEDVLHAGEAAPGGGGLRGAADDESEDGGQGHREDGRASAHPLPYTRKPGPLQLENRRRCSTMAE